MSTDYDMHCKTCKMTCHIGQRFTSGWAFGFGTNDKQGQLEAGDFIMEHAGHELHVFDAQDVRNDGAVDIDDLRAQQR